MKAPLPCRGTVVKNRSFLIKKGLGEKPNTYFKDKSFLIKNRKSISLRLT